MRIILMRADFCAFILTHGRPDMVLTYKSLIRSGYTGHIYLVLDDEDETVGQYQEKFGADRVLVFSKDAIAKEYDQADNFTDRRSVFYARNACWQLARNVGVRYFIQLDDDYFNFSYRLWTAAGYHQQTVQSGLNGIFNALITFLEESGAQSVAMSQGGDHVGGAAGNTKMMLKRKAMNSFICDVERPFAFKGRVNEDVNTYVGLGNKGALFFTIMPLQLEQTLTQTSDGGMSEMYRDSGTYIKSFYTVMIQPSSVTVRWQRAMGRLHHHVRWNDTVPKILPERFRKH